MGDDQGAFYSCDCLKGYVGKKCQVLDTETVTLAGAMTLIGPGANCHVIMSAKASEQGFKGGFAGDIVTALNDGQPEGDHVGLSQVGVGVECAAEGSSALVSYTVDYEMYIATQELVEKGTYFNR